MTRMAGSDRPNLLFVMCDQMRAHALGCYGNRLTRSPFLDSMAEAGTHVEHAISNCPVCVPARTLLLSGQYARSSLGRPSNTALSWTDSWDNPGWSFYPYCPEKREAFPQPTMPELLQRAGYHTAAIGKWHVDAWPHQLGFDDWLIPRSFHAHSNQLFTRNGEPEFAAPGFSVDFEADEMAKFFNRRAQEDAPWFMYYNISPPHMPLADMPEKYLTMYDPGDVTMRDNVERDLSKVGGHGGDFADRAAKYLWDYRNNIARLPHATRSGEGV
ncbi:MAG: sulfatase-like hydrolase/transferase, partial [Planctomycetota bacterium]